jgi:CDP-paratose 2-epimerase
MGRVLITGGAGFVGSSLAVVLSQSGHDVIALDSLRRRGSELNLPRLDEAEVEFVHGDVREPADLERIGGVDAIVECSAEPSAQAGADGDTGFVVQSNLIGAWNCLELSRRCEAQLIFLSTSRVYPYAALDALAFEENETRYVLCDGQRVAGASALGVSEQFSMPGPRTLYGATKLAAELLIEEYAADFGLRAVRNRCGLIAGPWQMGKADQGVVAHWVFHHHFDLPLRYVGYGGTGKQVRDVLHVADLGELVADQIAKPDHWAGFAGNVGGGRAQSISLRELAQICADVGGRELPLEGDPITRKGDVRIYISDCELLHTKTAWRPTRGVRDVVEDLFEWTAAHEEAVSAALGLRSASQRGATGQ